MATRLKDMDHVFQLLVLTIVSYAVFQFCFNILGVFRLTYVRFAPCYAVYHEANGCDLNFFGTGAQSYGYRITMALAPVVMNTLVPLAGMWAMLRAKRWGWWLCGGFFIYWLMVILRSSWYFIKAITTPGGIPFLGFDYSVLTKQVITLALAIVALLLLQKPVVRELLGIRVRSVQDIGASFVGIALLLYFSLYVVSFAASFIWVW